MKDLPKIIGLSLSLLISVQCCSVIGAGVPENNDQNEEQESKEEKERLYPGLPIALRWVPYSSRSLQDKLALVSIFTGFQIQRSHIYRTAIFLEALSGWKRVPGCVAQMALADLGYEAASLAYKKRGGRIENASPLSQFAIINGARLASYALVQEMAQKISKEAVDPMYQRNVKFMGRLVGEEVVADLLWSATKRISKKIGLTAILRKMFLRISPQFLRAKSIGAEAARELLCYVGNVVGKGIVKGTVIRSISDELFDKSTYISNEPWFEFCLPIKNRKFNLKFGFQL